MVLGIIFALSEQPEAKQLTAELFSQHTSTRVQTYFSCEAQYQTQADHSLTASTEPLMKCDILSALHKLE